MQSRKNTGRLLKLVSGLLLLFPLMLLQSCATQTVAPEVMKSYREKLPQPETTPTQVPVWPAQMTNGELLDLTRLFQSRLLSCNKDKEDLLKWQALLPVDPIIVTQETPPPPPKRWWQR